MKSREKMLTLAITSKAAWLTSLKKLIIVLPSANVLSRSNNMSPIGYK